MSHDLEEIQRDEAESKHREEMEAFTLMVERACHKKMTKQWMEEKVVADAKRSETENRRRIGKEHHKAPAMNANGKTISDFKERFEGCLKMRKTVLGAAKMLAEELGGAFTCDAIRKHAKRHGWATGQR